MARPAGLRALNRLYARRDRILLLVALYVLVAVVASTTYSFKNLYKTTQERENFAQSVLTNKTELTIYGSVYHGGSLGGLVAWRSLTICGVIASVIAVLLVVRYTRAEEDSGRAELVGSTSVDRGAPLSAAVSTVVGLLLATALVQAVVLAKLGLPAGGAFAFGLATAFTGMVYLGVAAVAAQLAPNARAARSVAVVVLAVFYVVRAIADSGGHTWLAWLSPNGWALQVRPWAGERWWVLALPLVLTALLVRVAGLLRSRRDLGSGMLPERLGPATGPASLSGPFGLAWRLHRGMLLGWSLGFLIVGLVIGGGATSIADQVGGNSQLAKVFTRIGGSGTLADSFVAAVMSILGLLAGAYAVQAVLRARAEETSGHLEPVLSTPVSRVKWLSGHLLFGLLGPAVALLAAGLGAGLTYGGGGSTGHELARVLGGAMAQLPAVWVLTAVTVALFGFAPRQVAASWGLLVVFLLLGQLGESLQLSHYVLDVSPFTQVPKLPGGDVQAAPLIWLVALAAVLTGAGVSAFRRRAVAP